MRTHIVLDDRLVREAMKLAGAKTLREAVDIALRRFVLHDDRAFEAIAAVAPELRLYPVK